jgi:UDP-glucose 4-epimerase
LPVYGQAEKMPITEDASIQKRCLLMEIKQIGEEIITDVAKVSHINAMRYFNPIEHPSAEIGELPIEYLKTLPFITQTGFDYEKSSLLRR